MKKILKALFLVVIFGIVFSISDVHAAYAYYWNIGGETISRGQSTAAGNVSWVEDSQYLGDVLILNNYTGGPLKLICVGTGMNQVFAIKLVGNNKITAKDAIGILASNNIEFIGDGTLTIESAIPIFDDYSIIGDAGAVVPVEDLKLQGNTTIKIDLTNSHNVSNNSSNSSSAQPKEDTTNSSEATKDIDEGVTTTDEDDATKEKDDKVTDSKNDNVSSNQSLINIIALVYGVISLIVIIILAVQLRKSKLTKI